MNLMRLLKHRWLDERDARRALGPGALERIEARVKASELLHSGEIRVCVEAGLPLSYLRRDAMARERAVTLFGKLRVWDTESNNGVLIYLLLAGMSTAFKAGRFEDGLMQAVDVVDRLLARHFALREGEVNPNELPDAPLVM